MRTKKEIELEIKTRIGFINHIRERMDLSDLYKKIVVDDTKAQIGLLEWVIA